MLTYHMNAVRVKEKQLAKIDPREWIMEEKFKGIRAWRIKTPEGVKLITRGLQDISDNFPHLVKLDWTPNFEYSQLDCELYDPEQEDEVVSGWANTIAIDPNKTEKTVLKVFDVLNLNQISLAHLPQIERKAILHKLKLKGPLETVKFYNAEDHRSYYDYILSQGGEGIMLKNRMATYEEKARRVKFWLKRKKRDPYDCVVIGFTKAKEGKFDGLIGAAVVGQYVKGILRPICNVSGMTDVVRKDMTNHPEKYIGKACSIWAMEQDQNSLALIEPSWCTLRMDKLPEDCIYKLEDFIDSDEERMVDL